MWYNYWKPLWLVGIILAIYTFLDVTQRSPKRGRALRDIPKTAARETNIT